MLFNILYKHFEVKSSLISALQIAFIDNTCAFDLLYYVDWILENIQ